MLAKNMSNLLPTLGFVLVLIIASMLVVSFFGVNLDENRGLRVLNRAAVFEGMQDLDLLSGGTNTTNNNDDDDDDVDDEDEDEDDREGLLVEPFLEGSITMEKGKRT